LGYGINAHDKDVIQNSFTIAHKSGIYFNPWRSDAAGSHFLDNENAWATEVNYTLGWAGPIKSDTTASSTQETSHS
jgi:hypothetical protein